MAYAAPSGPLFCVNKVIPLSFSFWATFSICRKRKSRKKTLRSLKQVLMDISSTMPLEEIEKNQESSLVVDSVNKTLFSIVQGEAWRLPCFTSSPIVVRRALVFLHPIQEVVRRVAVTASCVAVWEKQSPGGRYQPVQQAKGQDRQLEHQFKGPDGKLDQYYKRPDEEIIAEREKQADHGFLSFFCHYIRRPPDGQSASGSKEHGILDQMTACRALMPEKEGKRPRRGWSFGDWVDGAQGGWYHRGEAGKRLILQESPPSSCSACLRVRLSHRSCVHRTGGLTRAFSTALSTPKRYEIPCLVDKTVDNVDNFPGSAVDKWKQARAKREIPGRGAFFRRRRDRVDRGRSLGYNGVNGQACRKGGQ